MGWVRVTTAAMVAVVALGTGCAGGDNEGVSSAAERGAGDSASAAGAPGNLTSSRVAGTLASPRKPAPPLALSDSFGRPVDLKRYRGDAVIVTFLYANCPDVCPLIADNLRAAQLQLGPAAKDLHLLAVSVDPENDSPRAVNRFLASHRVTDTITYLLGSRPALEAIWSDWGVISERDPRKNDPHFIEHSAMIYGVSASGEVTTIYPSSFDPADIVHDAPILASR